MAWIAALGAVLLASGVVALVAALRPAGSAPGPPRTFAVAQRFRTRIMGASAQRGRRVGVIAGAILGLLVWMVTGWMVAAIIFPAAAAIVPALLQVPDTKRTIKRLEAMEEWTRNLAGVLTVGVGLDQAIMASLRSTPDQILPEVSATHVRVGTDQWTLVRNYTFTIEPPTGEFTRIVRPRVAPLMMPFMPSSSLSLNRPG